MSSNRPVWENSDLFGSRSLSMKETTPTNHQEEGGVTTPQYGPAQEGITYELCAGIVDKKLSLAEIAREEVEEETGYKITTDNLQYVTSFWSNIG